MNTQCLERKGEYRLDWGAQRGDSFVVVPLFCTYVSQLIEDKFAHEKNVAFENRFWVLRVETSSRLHCKIFVDYKINN